VCGSTTSSLCGREAVSRNRTSGSCAKAVSAASPAQAVSSHPRGSGLGDSRAGGYVDVSSGRPPTGPTRRPQVWLAWCRRRKPNLRRQDSKVVGAGESAIWPIFLPHLEAREQAVMLLQARRSDYHGLTAGGIDYSERSGIGFTHSSGSLATSQNEFAIRGLMSSSQPLSGDVRAGRPLRRPCAQTSSRKPLFLGTVESGPPCRRAGGFL